MSAADEFWSSQSRVSYFWLEQGLDDDPTFRHEALAILRHVNPIATHTEASSAMELLNHWITQRELTVYHRGRPVEDVAAVVLYGERGDDYTRAASAVEQGWRIDRAEFVELLTRYKMTAPNFLTIETTTTDGEKFAEGDTPTAPPPLENWKMRIQAEAAIRWREQRRQDCSPTKHALKNELAKWCRDKKVVTETTRITPDPQYIYRHVLRQWTPPKDD